MRTSARSVAVLAIGMLAASCLAAEHGDNVGVFAPDKIKWGDGPKSIPPGAKLAVLEGDPSKAEPFLMRLKLASRIQDRGTHASHG